MPVSESSLRSGSRPCFGIIGGMGPAASAALFEAIIRATPAKSDQDHFHVIVNSDPSIPDRTEAILGKGPSPVPGIVKSAKFLESSGASHLLLPCMTSHAFLSEIQRQIAIPIVNTVGLLEAEIIRMFGLGARIGLLATDGSRAGGVFDPLGEMCDLLLPGPAAQGVFMESVYGPRGIKAIGANEAARRMLDELILEFQGNGACALIAGCTEVSVGLARGPIPLTVIDPLKLLADYAVAIGASRDSEMPIPVVNRQTDRTKVVG